MNNFKFDHVGSLLRNENLKKAKKDLENNVINIEEYNKVVKEEIKKNAKKQYDIGLRAITDGEYNREYWHYDFISKLNGIHNYILEMNGSFNGALTKIKSYYVEDKLSFNDRHPFLDDFKYLKSICDELGEDVVAKFTIPGPNMIYYSGVVKTPLFKEKSKYTNLEDVKKDIIKVYNDAILAFYNAGCRYLQLDDTAWGALFSEDSRNEMKEKGINPEELLKDFSYLTIESIKNKPEDMFLTTHCCRGNFKSNWLYEGDYSFVADEMFKSNFDKYFLEFDTERAGDLKYIKNIKNNVSVGLITTKDGKLEDKEVIKNRLNEALKYVDKNRLCLSPQCGFASTEEGNNITEKEQWNKLKFVVEVAKEVL